MGYEYARYPGIHDVAYVTEKHIVAVVDTNSDDGNSYFEPSKVLVTKDGGKTWEAIEFPDDQIDALDMLDENFGLVKTMPINPLPGQPDGNCYFTNDGGLTWTPAPSYPPALLLRPQHHAPWDIHALSPTTWCLVAQIGANRYLYRTEDAGESWQRSEEPFNDIWWTGVTFINEDVAWAVGGRPNGAGNQRSDLILKSTDGGVTWETKLDEEIDYKLGLRAIDFADEMNGLAVGTYGKVLRTTDGGEIWVQEWTLSQQTTEYLQLRGIIYTEVDKALAWGDRGGVFAYHGEEWLKAPQLTKPDLYSNQIAPLTTTIEWTPIEGATSYEVQVADTTIPGATADNFLYWKVFDDPFLQQTGITGTSLELHLFPYTRYILRVRAHGGEIEELTSDWSHTRVIHTQGEPVVVEVPAFVDPTPEDGSENQPLKPEFAWTTIADAAGYDFVLIGQDDNKQMKGSFYESHLSEPAYHAQALLKNTTYYAKVRARNQAGYVSEWSPYTLFKTGVTSSVEGKTTIDFMASIQPNIATDQAELLLSLGQPQSLTLSVVDMNGQQMMRQKLPMMQAGMHRHLLDVSELPSGHYLVVISETTTRLNPVVVLRPPGDPGLDGHDESKLSATINGGSGDPELDDHDTQSNPSYYQLPLIIVR